MGFWSCVNSSLKDFVAHKDCAFVTAFVLQHFQGKLEELNEMKALCHERFAEIKEICSLPTSNRVTQYTGLLAFTHFASQQWG